MVKYHFCVTCNTLYRNVRSLRCVSFLTHLYKYTHQGSVSSSLLLMKTGVCSSTWVACLYRQCCSLPQLCGCRLFYFILFFSQHSVSSRALRFWNRPGHAIWCGLGVGGFIQVFWPVLLLLSLWCCVRPARCWSSIREPSVPALEMNRRPVNGAWLWGPVVSPLLYTEAGI